MTLTDEQVRLLTIGTFHIDGWCRPRPITLEAIQALLKAELLRSWESGSDEAQYTAMNFQITDAGQAALREHQQKAEQSWKKPAANKNGSAQNAARPSA